MRFPEFLYRMLTGDAGSQHLEARWREASSSVIDATVSASISVPNDKVLVLTNAVVKTTRGASNVNVAARRLFADPPQGDTRYEILNSRDIVSQTNTALNWQGEVVIPGGWKVKAEGIFGGAVEANTVELEIFGYLIPRGTFVFG